LHEGALSDEGGSQGSERAGAFLRKSSRVNGVNRCWHPLFSKEDFATLRKSDLFRKMAGKYQKLCEVCLSMSKLDTSVHQDNSNLIMLGLTIA